MKTARKMVSMLLAIAMLVTCVPSAVFAARIYSFNSVEELFEEYLIPNPNGAGTLTDIKGRGLFSYETPKPVQADLFTVDELRRGVVMGQEHATENMYRLQTEMGEEFLSVANFRHFYERVPGNGRLYQLKNLTFDSGIVLTADVKIAGQRYPVGTRFIKRNGRWMDEGFRVIGNSAKRVAEQTVAFRSVSEFFEEHLIPNPNGAGTLADIKGRGLFSPMAAQPVEASYLSQNDIARIYTEYAGRGEGYLIRAGGKESFVPVAEFRKLYTQVSNDINGSLYKFKGQAIMLEQDVTIAGKTYRAGTIFEEAATGWRQALNPNSYKSFVQVYYDEGLTKIGAFVKRVAQKIHINPSVFESALFRSVFTKTAGKNVGKNAAKGSGLKIGSKLLSGIIGIGVFAAVTYAFETKVEAREVTPVADDELLEKYAAELGDFDNYDEYDKVGFFVRLSTDPRGIQMVRSSIINEPKFWNSFTETVEKLDQLSEQEVADQVNALNQEDQSQQVREQVIQNIVEGTAVGSFSWQNSQYMWHK